MSQPVTSHEPDGSGAFLFGLVAGGLVAAALTFWKTPQSGAELRQKMAQQAGGTLARGRALVAGERMEDAVAEGKALAQQRQAEMTQSA
jgi:gas vesicle protein